MPTIHMIHGYIGAGKTTFARKLEQDLPAIRFTHDHWMTRLYGDNPPADQMPEMTERVSSLLQETWVNCVKMGLDTVLDLNFWSLSDRDETRRIAQELGVKTKLYALNLPEDEAWRRTQNRNQDLNGSFYISKNTFEVLKAQFEPLTPQELETAIRIYAISPKPPQPPAQ